MKIDFLIENIDPLGQGVSKKDGNITFIKKTLPGESGNAEIINQKKSVTFARALKVESPSKDRIRPECVHYDNCNGCDFLHTSYEKEVEFKLINIKRSLHSFLSEEKISFHRANQRFSYRNRIQLHYNKRDRKIGFLSSDNKIVDIKLCLTADNDINKKLQEISSGGQWIDLVKKEVSNEGHIELYKKNGKVQIYINKPYANEGFTQVNEAMNGHLINLLTEKVKKMIGPNDLIFDLFGGNGNLSAKLKNPALVVDQYTQTPAPIWHQTFLNQNLYDKPAIKNIRKLFPHKNPELIIFDPPRSGLKNLSDYLTEFSPGHFLFIACEFSSFLRDTKPTLENYILNEIHIVDLFPGTHHFETIGLFTKRSK